MVIAAPVGSFLGALVGVAGHILCHCADRAAALVWKWLVLPKMPPVRALSAVRMFGLLRNRAFALGMASTALAFIGMNSLSIYLRPFLERVTALKVNILSPLFGVGLVGLAAVARHLDLECGTLGSGPRQSVSRGVAGCL
jgi:predicted MFS family arabinose efflux permease